MRLTEGRERERAKAQGCGDWGMGGKRCGLVLARAIASRQEGVTLREEREGSPRDDECLSVVGRAKGEGKKRS